MCSPRHAWKITLLLAIAQSWFQQKRREMRRVSENSGWWAFVWPFRNKLPQMVRQFANGNYRFSPMKSYCFPDETILTWDYPDRLALHLIWEIIRPVARHFIPARSYYFNGGTKKCLRDIHQMLTRQHFEYAIRIDIKSYYASIDRGILLQQLNHYFKDPILSHYFDQIVNIPVDRNAAIINKSKGIPRRSTLSPFFGTLYLMPLLNALQQRKGCECFLYMDDLLVLVKTRRQYQQARKILFQQLDQLKLKLSPKKSKMGKLNQFHFLGLEFRLSQNNEKQNQIHVRLHAKTCTRALSRVKALSENSVHPEHKQRYLRLWGRWWSTIIRPVSFTASLQQWICHCLRLFEVSAAWLARGLLPLRLACYFPTIMRECAETSL